MISGKKGTKGKGREGMGPEGKRCGDEDGEVERPERKQYDEATKV